MSSALIFANGDFNDGTMVQRALAQAHIASALMIAADGGARAAVFFGVVPEVVIGDMDSLDEDQLAALEERGAVIMRYPPQKDETDLELALLYAFKNGVTTIRIIGAVGDRLDHTLSNIALLALPTLRDCDTRIVAGEQEAWLMPPGTCTIDGTAGDTVSLLPLNGDVNSIRTDGLEYPLRDETLHFGPARGVSNVMTGSRATITTADGILLIVHTVGRA
jgi:thiamine pyrophosphokinase